MVMTAMRGIWERCKDSPVFNFMIVPTAKRRQEPSSGAASRVLPLKAPSDDGELPCT